MNAADLPFPTEAPSDDTLQQEYQVLQEFLHLAPVGLLRMSDSGEITVMNPMAAQLLTPLGLGLGQINLFEVLESYSQDIRMLVQTFSDTVGVICENFRVLLPQTAESDDGPLALGVTVMRVSARDDPLMVVVTDQSNAVKLQRLQGGFMR
jgi:nitrogen-specific signal transduction histidine kinase